MDGVRVLHFAAAYGFRNIQNLVRKIKQGRCEYQFVEIMACPGGCLNGGGQIKARKGQTAKDLIQRLETAYLQEVTARALSGLVPRLQYRPWQLKVVGWQEGSAYALDVCRCADSWSLCRAHPKSNRPILIPRAAVLQVTIRDPADNPLVKDLYKTWLGAPYSEEARRLLHTQYHERERTVTASISNW